jgi:hypothetical protein
MKRFLLFPACVLAAALMGCTENPSENADWSRTRSVPLPPDAPHELLLGVLDEIQSISDGLSEAHTSKIGARLVLQKGAADTLIVYGQRTADGYGAVVSERRSYPRGILLITVRKTYGKENNTIVSELRRYTTYAALAADEPEQSTLTEVTGLSQDTILTKVTRNGRTETYTFRMPVVTVTLKSDPAQSRRVRRYAQNGEILVETQDGTGQHLQLQRHSTASDGSLIVLTEYPDGTWRRSRTLGQSDGTILRETTTSQ